MNKPPTLAVIGLGYVGLPLAILAAKKGWRVIGVDVDEQKLRAIKARASPFSDSRVQEDLRQGVAIETTGDFSVIRSADIIVICVPTPVHDNFSPDLEPLMNAACSIAGHLKRRALVVVESTVNPGVTEDMVAPLLEVGSGFIVGQDIHLAHCPERINPGDAEWPLEKIPRVAGAGDPRGLKKTLAFYRSILNAEVRPMQSIREAEAVKVVENAFRDINIAFVNELACSFNALKIDLVNVLEGAAIKPFGFMAHFPGCGVGGHCIPVDPYYLIQYAKDNGFEHRFLALAREINNNMPRFTVRLLKQCFHERSMSLHGRKIAVLGLAYKPDIDDDRNSPSYAIVSHLERLGALISTFDPYVKAHSSVPALESALAGADGVIIATAHRKFRELTPDIFEIFGVKIVVDGRNCLHDAQKDFARRGILYRGIGASFPEETPAPDEHKSAWMPKTSIDITSRNRTTIERSFGHEDTANPVLEADFF